MMYKRGDLVRLNIYDKKGFRIQDHFLNQLASTKDVSDCIFLYGGFGVARVITPTGNIVTVPERFVELQAVAEYKEASLP